jgi:uncharacterized membrane protein YeaQ/YmgE (transglycosylase-associated protein family)
VNIFIWLIVGGLLGWVASIFMGTNSRQGIILNVVVGIVGAMLGGRLLSRMLGSSTINQGNFSLSGLLVSLLGAIILLVFAKLLGGLSRR